MACKVVHFEITGKDGAALQKFYGDLFDWEINADNEMNYGLVTSSGDGSIGGGIGPSPEGMPSHVTFYVEVDNIDAYLEKINGAGGKTVVPKTTIPNMVTFALFADPEGNMVGLVEAAES